MADSDDEDELLVTFAMTSVAAAAATFMLGAAATTRQRKPFPPLLSPPFPPPPLRSSPPPLTASLAVFNLAIPVLMTLIFIQSTHGLQLFSPRQAVSLFACSPVAALQSSGTPTTGTAFRIPSPDPYQLWL